jgi:hypothetical protein
MLLLIHIVVAVLGLALSTFSLLIPSVNKIKASYLAVGATIVSGTALVIRDHLSILSVCLSGLLYVGFTFTSLILASHRLARQAKRID